MRGGIARWKRGVAGQGLRAATAYALGGVCDVGTAVMTAPEGLEKAEKYADEHVHRFTLNTAHGIEVDALGRDELRAWIDGRDPVTREQRGRVVSGANADLLFDATVNTPKSLSVAAMLDDELQAGLDKLHDTIRDRAMALWLAELNSRRGAGGSERMDLAQIEVVELRHERSRALDPHVHRHLWLNAKVLGTDGRWSNVDSRVLLRFQTILNAEGDLATVTDPEWRALLARKGLSVDTATGEIAELAHLTAPLSRRSRQIEAARATRLAQWHDEHPGMAPAPEDLRAIDRWAWAYGRPGKPSNFDEDSWRATVLAEVAEVDPGIAASLAQGRPELVDEAPALEQLDHDWLALAALAEADARSTSASGRFSRWDVRAAAQRALARTGVCVDRAELDAVIGDVVDRALGEHVIDLAADQDDVPPHLRHFVARDTALAKTDLDARLARLGTAPSVPVADDDVRAVAADVSEHPLDDAQLAAAAAIAGTGRLVTVIGPAGAGKTTMLTVARHLLEAQGRRALIVAPTKKAASVAGRETGAPAASIHQLLHHAGWRWGEDEFGRTRWQRLETGDVDATTGEVWQGSKLQLDFRTRIVVDEAGMVDLDAARALAQLAEETGCELAFVGDPQQVLPVGHSGAMALAQRHAAAAIELESIHRFRREDGTLDTGWADLTRRLRQPESDAAAELVAAELVARDRVQVVASTRDAHELLAQRWLDWHGRGNSAAVVVATNEEARAINEMVQERRLATGQVKAGTAAAGMDDQQVHVGDVVQTRRNDRATEVENRAIWRVTGIDDETVTLASTGVDDVRRTVSRDYAARHLQLAYATTVHGIQGETVQRAITGPGVDAAGLYVGLTRGKRLNEVVVIAGDERAARQQLVEQMRRGQPETDLAESRSVVLREIAVAARRRAGSSTGRPLSWRERQHGRIVRIDDAVAAAAARVPHSHEQVQAMRDRVEALQATLRELDLTDAVELTTSDLAQRGESVELAPADDRDGLVEQLDEANARLRQMQQDNSEPLRVLDELIAERTVRSRVLSRDERAREDRGRLAQTDPAAVPVQGGRDRGFDPGGPSR